MVTSPLWITDSLAALHGARRRGLVPAEAKVHSFSPAIVGREGIVAADATVTPERIRDLELAVLALSEDLFAAFADNRDEALVLARSAIADLQGLAFHALALGDRDLATGVKVVGVAYADSWTAERLGPPFAAFGAAGSAIEAVTVPETEVGVFQSPLPPVAPLTMRLRAAPLPSLGYRIAANFWRRLGRAGPKGSVLVVRENELLKETAFHLTLKGFAIHRLDLPAIADATAPRAALVDKAHIADMARGRLSKVLPPAVAGLVATVFADAADRAVERYRRSTERLLERLERDRHLRPRAMLSNVKFEPEAVAIHTASRRIGIPAYFFAHGFAAELSARETAYHARHENSLGDGAFVFNDRTREHLDANPIRVGKTFVVGLTRDHLRRPAGRPRAGDPPIWYVSTALYNGNLPLLCYGVSDGDMAASEMAVIDATLSRLPHRVLYKPYPGSRYLDPDPVVEHARAMANVAVSDERIDLRYVIGRARVLVTARATSTVCWCLLSGRPTVFIDYPDQLPLTEDARAGFREGAFLFDADKEGWHDRLREFLSQPIEAIETEWDQRAPARQKLLARFFSSNSDGRAGARAAAIIGNELARSDTAIGPR